MTTLRRLVWIGSSRRDMRALPLLVKRTFGLALFAVQSGDTPPIAKPLKASEGPAFLNWWKTAGMGPIGRSTRCDFAAAIYVLHVFQKKSRKARETPRHDIDLIRLRLRHAEVLEATARKDDEE